MKKTTKKRMSRAPSKSTAKRDAYALGAVTRPGKAIAKNRARKDAALSEAMSALRSSRKKK